MELQSAVIKNNDRFMKTCILYEAINKNPIFDSYREFCKLVGQDAMEYPDFEFWYYRFYHKQHDFDYDRSADPVPKTIMDMPVSLMFKITENLDTVERTHLRTINKSLKDVVDSRSPVFDEIKITAYDKFLSWKLDDKSFCCEITDYGCSLRMPNLPEIKSDEYYLKKGMEYLSPVLKMPNIQINHLSLYITKESAYLNDFLPIPFHAKSVSISAFDINKSIELLSIMNPGELESIEFNIGGTITREIVLEFCDTEQFKQATNVKSTIFLNENELMKFSHLKTFKCSLTSQEPVDVQRIRDIISTFDKFESCKLKRTNYGNDLDIRTFARALETEIPFGPLKIITHRYRIPESNEYLEFKIEEKEYLFSIKIVKIR
ncbi:hypothetical protein B9Z55_026930 [Caenorhabditis nigoni]|uniref:F-box domain-containing protein n=1 Tax=Caenorhabditis nigoni TaxID=1611254 RepID=A0A2G5SI32_9PELO|nr:hypothetical protein B9Z55_026930 [Caenorhabditis nigoni]